MHSEEQVVNERASEHLEVIIGLQIIHKAGPIRRRLNGFECWLVK